MKNKELLHKRFMSKFWKNRNETAQEKRDRILLDFKVNLKTNDLVINEHRRRQEEFVKEFESNIPFIMGEDENNIGDNYWAFRSDTYNHFFPGSYSQECFRFKLYFDEFGLPELEKIVPFMEDMKEKYGSDSLIENENLVVYVPFKDEHRDYYFKNRKSAIERKYV